MIKYVIYMDPGTYVYLEPNSCAKMIEQVPYSGWNIISPQWNHGPLLDPTRG